MWTEVTEPAVESAKDSELKLKGLSQRIRGGDGNIGSVGEVLIRQRATIVVPIM